jgi:hypothetical protein
MRLNKLRNVESKAHLCIGQGQDHFFVWDSLCEVQFHIQNQDKWFGCVSTYRLVIEKEVLVVENNLLPLQFVQYKTVPIVLADIDVAIKQKKT